MKAIIATGYGGPEVLQLREVEKPSPKENEVLIQIKAASISRADCMMRTGKPYIGRLFLGISKPKHPIPGTGFAGIIEAVGASVQNFKKGDSVFGESIHSFGTNAEYVCLDESGLIYTLPENVSFEEAASLCDGALTSMNFLKNVGEISPGQKILINGAAGGLGSAAVQLAKHFGAEVTAVCGPNNLQLAKDLGADKVIDYTKNNFTTNYQNYDVIYDTVGKSSFSKGKKALKEKGKFISPVLHFPFLGAVLWSSLFGKKKAKFSATGALPIKELKPLLEELITIIKEGKIKTVLDRTYTLAEIKEAHIYVDKGHKKGNIVLVN
mgnify:CR=1 FL=1